VTLPEIAKYRLLNQQIAETKLKSAVNIIQWFGAVQAQEFAQAKWGLGLRLPHIKDDDIERGFAEGKIIRTHLLRPTWHFVASQDIRWLLTLTAPRVNTANAYMYRQLELDSKVFNRCNDILIETLCGGKQLTRDTINEEFQKSKIIAKGHRLSYIMMYAELAGIICSGARQGNQFTYTLLDERICATNSLTKDESLAELTKRYFLSRGPATIKDFSTWSGLTLTNCKKGIKMVKSLFNSEVVENQEYFFPSAISLDKKQFQKIYILPVYDEFIMGYKDRSAITVFKNNSKPTSASHYDSMIIFEGQIIGTWKRTIAKKSIDMEFELFKRLNKNQIKAFDRAVHRFGEFSNMMVNYEKIKTTNR
jgi:hypothetical protein